MESVAMQEAATKKTDTVPIFKGLQILVDVVYVVYDSFTIVPPGPGTVGLIIVTILFEFLLIYQEVDTMRKVQRVQRSPTVTQMTFQGAAPEMMSDYPIHASAGYPMQSVSHGPESRYIHTPEYGRPIDHGQPMF
jgi:hypothetical protein